MRVEEGIPLKYPFLGIGINKGDGSSATGSVVGIFVFPNVVVPAGGGIASAVAHGYKDGGEKTDCGAKLSIFSLLL
jgi:hypothetical protein